MNTRKPQFYYLMALLAGTLLLVFFIFRPFLNALIMAMVFAVVFQPVHQRVLGFTRKREGSAAIITTLFIITIILVPVILLGIQIFQEAQQLYSSIAGSGGKKIIHTTIKSMLADLRKFFPVIRGIPIDVDLYLKEGLDWLIRHLGDVFSNFATMLMNMFIFIISLYYLLKDGHRLKKTFLSLSPLPDSDDEIIFNKLESSINSVIKGNLVIAVIQGVLSAAGFAVFGVPNAMLWGSVTAIAALIPGVGTSLVLIPAILFLFLSGEVLSGFGLLVWGAGAVGLIDNFLGPKLVGRGMKMHPLIILLSVLGGIGFFGPIGFLLGPLAVSLLFAFFEILSSIKSREKDDEANC